MRVISKALNTGASVAVTARSRADRN
jgi:hypothetical protein